MTDKSKHRDRQVIVSPKEKAKCNQVQNLDLDYDDLKLKSFWKHKP